MASFSCRKASNTGQHLTLLYTTIHNLDPWPAAKGTAIDEMDYN